MAIVNDPRWRVLDTSGNAIVGATMTVYTAGTTTLASIYSDAGLTTAMTNPLAGVNASDANGRFPQWFAAEGLTFDILLKDSGGSLLADGSYVSVPAVGQSNSTLLRDFGGSRFQVRNSAGVVQIETGDASGDDVGGQARLGGWNGTQGDSLSLDYALLNTTGRFTENSKKLPGIVYTEGTFSAVATVDIALPNSPTGVRNWALEVWDLSASTSLNLLCRFSYDSGATYKSNTTYNSKSVSDGSATTVATSSSITLAALGTTGSTDRNRATYRISGADSTGFFTNVHGWTVTDADTFILVSGTYRSDAGRPTNIRLLPSTGTITGRYRLIPLRGLGE